MRGWQTLSATLMLCGLTGVVPVAAQQDGSRTKRDEPKTLDAVLEQLQVNLNRYDTNIPSFFCDEHAVSSEIPGLSREDTDNYSIFRLKRVVNPDHKTSRLEESRQLKTVNGHAPTGDEIGGPDLLQGAFAGGFAMVSREQESCMNYKLERRKENVPGAPYVIGFASVLTPQNIEGCLLQEDGKGRVFVDPATMQITRLELTMPHHTINAGDAYHGTVKGEWRVTVWYAPVELDKQTFWLPATIDSRTISGGGTYHEREWTFRADYSNFHKLEVHSRLLPAGTGDAP
jgi:hypothetical protein